MTPVAIPAASILPTALGPVACIVEGEGPAFLAVHGGMGGVEQSWLLARALLGESPGYRVVALARPGYPGTPLSLGCSPEEQADLYAAVLDALGEDSAMVAAVSAGGPSALQFALRHPARTRGLILVSACTGRLETPRKIRSRMRMMQIVASLPGVAASLARRQARNPEASLKRSISDPEVRARTLAHPEAADLLRALGASVMRRLRERLPGTINDIRLFAEIETPPLERLRAPVLVVHGDVDPIVPFSHAQAVAARAPAAERLTIEGGEHVALFTHLDRVRERIAAFLTSRDSDG